MTLIIKRKWREGEALIGELYLDGVYECFTLEPLSEEIATGTYPLLLTVSERARKGQLWSPRADGCLPLVEQVPGRSGIRIHAGNKPEDSDGCVLVGTVRGTIPGKIFGSRAALAALITKIGQARDSVKLTVEDA